jgi:predicted glycoside hydrolase/deacetylase ChbG (UPF0249 family)
VKEETMSGSLLEKLGIAPGARVPILHADDLGMCHAANVAYQENLAFGVVKSGSVMMTCSWAPEIAAWCRSHPEADVGVHITLNSEYDEYRWAPLSTCDPKSGLIDEEGYMWRSIADVHRHADPDAAAAEMRAQVDRALSLGIDVTHIDTHMGTVFHPQLVRPYIQLAIEYRIPLMLPRVSRALMVQEGIDPAWEPVFGPQVEALAESGLPVLDYTCSARERGDRLEVYQRLLAGLPPGITHVRTHPSVPGMDIEVITSSAPDRIADYQTFLRPELKAFLEAQDILPFGYRPLRDLMRGMG